MMNLEYIKMPIELLERGDLNSSEKILLSLIIVLSTNKGECFLSNSTVENILNVGNRQASRLVNNLKNKGLISIKYLYKPNSYQIQSRLIKPLIRFE